MTHPTGSDLRRAAVIFLAATLAALLVRVLYVLQMSDQAVNPHFARPILDAAVHHRWAQQILAGSWPPPEPFFRAPLYPFFLAGLYGVFGAGNPLAVQLVHALVSALGAGLAALCALRIWSERAAWFAGIGYALLWPSIYFSGELLDVTLGVTLNLLLWWLLLGDTGKRRLFLAGLVWGLSAISRPLVLALLPVVVIYLRRRGMGWRSPAWLVLAGGLAVAILPVTAHNLLRGGEPVLIAASGGANFYIGNNEYSDGRVAFLPGAPLDWQGEVSEVKALAKKETGREHTAISADRHFLDKGLKYWSREPAAAMSLLGKKVRILLSADERSNNKNLPFWRGRSSLLRWPVWVGWAPVLALAIIGLRRRDHDRNQGFLLWGSVLMYAAVLLLFFINARFRLPLLAWLMVPAGAGAARLLRAVRLGDWNRRTRAGLGIAVAVLLVVWVPDYTLNRHDPGQDYDNWRQLGDGFLDAGDRGRARDAYLTARGIDTLEPRRENAWTLPSLYLRLGGIMTAEGDGPQVMALYEDWVKRLPEDVEARVQLSGQYLNAGMPEKALPLLDAAVRMNPRHPGARLGLGWARLQTGDPRGGLAEFQQAIRMGGSEKANYGSGMCLLEMQRWAEAEAEFKTVVRRNPRHWQAYGGLAGVYEATGRPSAAREAWRRVLEINPRDVAAREGVGR